jgi:hypothetical protein
MLDRRGETKERLRKRDNLQMGDRGGGEGVDERRESLVLYK